MSDSATGPETAEGRAARRQGAGLARVLLVALAGALLIGLAGFAASTVISPDKPVVSTMCVDSSCSFAMSGDTSMPSNSMAATPRPATQRRSPPARLVDRVLRLVHLR